MWHWWSCFSLYIIFHAAVLSSQVAVYENRWWSQAVVTFMSLRYNVSHTITHKQIIHWPLNRHVFCYMLRVTFTELLKINNRLPDTSKVIIIY